MPLKDFTGNPSAAQSAREPDGARPGENTRQAQRVALVSVPEPGRKQPSRDNTTGFYLCSLFFPINSSRFPFPFRFPDKQEVYEIRINLFYAVVFLYEHYYIMNNEGVVLHLLENRKEC